MEGQGLLWNETEERRECEFPCYVEGSMLGNVFIIIIIKSINQINFESQPIHYLDSKMEIL